MMEGGNQYEKQTFIVFEFRDSNEKNSYTVNKKISVINIRWTFWHWRFLYSYMENIQFFTHYFACYGAFPIPPFFKFYLK